MSYIFNIFDSISPPKVQHCLIFESFFFLFAVTEIKYQENVEALLISELLIMELHRGHHWIKLESYRVESRITSRFCHTTFKSFVVNSGPNAQSIGFHVQIPKRAFITNFTMNVNGVTFVGSVKEKTVARNLYAQARARGKAAGIVRANSQDMETFKAEVHVPSGNRIEFELHYQEMMYRKLGLYEHTLHLQPGRLLDVYIYEPNGIASVEVPNTLGEHFTGLAQVTSNKHKAHVVFKPSLKQQRKCDNCTTSALSGIFTVKYDVIRESAVSDGHFVHFFAPTNLSPLPKNIVFVIDVSGSMWGVKMKQTVEAMQAILDDLTMDDYFSIIDFNHNVRCWSDELVQGSTIQVAEAKKYIQDIKPNGGTNINEALLRAGQILHKAANQGMLNSRSVSMIILVSDGDPTVGEIKLSAIQKNVKKIMREDFSLFSLGIGFDVDYDFLERIATENRVSPQRCCSITTSPLYDCLHSFEFPSYSPYTIPLPSFPSPITVLFPEGSVSDVTQNSFDKYFSGSELVVAGKVLPSDGTSLNSFITASSTEADYMRLDAELARQQHAFTGFARQMWAYITVNQLLSERSQAPTASRKRKITQRILNLAVEHQFVTPLTALLVESEEANEKLLADSPKDPRKGCCGGLTTTPTPSPALGPLPERLTIVDNDPHFIIHLPKNNMDVCFNIDSKPGHILNLVSDPGTGVVVNGQLVGSKRVGVEKENVKTYFGTISVFSKLDGIMVTVSTDRIQLTDSKHNHSFSWGATADITQDRVKVSIVKDSQVTVTVDEKIRVMMLLHRVWKKHPTSVDFLGLYIPNSNQYSSKAHGLIGQFGQEPEVRVYNLHQGADPLKKEATMEVKGNKLAVTRGWQKDYRRDKKRGSDIFCWFIHNSGKGFIDGHYTTYIVPRLDSFLQRPL
uniref:Inter-alpha-trypsin inhibitor heavy chain 2 n=1 Tax=Esox lucius TaxID=8010 RepID=A0A6Q2XPM9_ESOLU